MATKTKTGFGVTCPHCNDSEATVSLDVNDVRQVTCSCGEEFTVASAVYKARESLAAWERLARWVDAAPTTD